MKKSFKLITVFILTLLLIIGCSNGNNNNDNGSKGNSDNEKVSLTISAAASLKDAMDVIEKMYKDDHPEVTLEFNFGASGSLQQQISQGAPVDLFFSAAEDKFDLLVDEGSIKKEDGSDLLINELVLVTSEDNKTINSFEDLSKKDVESISIGTPESVPAGKYAKESLENIGLWNDIEAKLIYAKDVRQVLSYVETGNVDAGIVYKTDALISDKVSIVGSAEEGSHTPIVYPVGVIKDSKHYNQAQVFYEFLQTPDVIKVFEEYGFTAK